MTAVLASTTTAGSATAAASASINVPTGTANNDLLILAVNVGSGVTTITTPTGWTLLQNRNDTFDTHLSVYYRVAASEPASYTVSWSSTSMYAMSMQRWTGASASTPIRTSVVGGASGTGATYTPGTNLTGVQSTDVTLWIGQGGDDSGTTGDTFTMPGSPWTTAYNLAPSVIGSSMTKGQGGTYQTGAVSAPTFTCSSSTWIWNAVGLAIEAGGPTTWNATASMSEAATLTSAPTVTGFNTASLAETSTFTSNGVVSKPGTANLSEASTLSASSGYTALPTAALTEALSLAATPTATYNVSTTMTASSGFTVIAPGTASPLPPAYAPTPTAPKPDPRERQYTAVAYSTVTGRVIADLDLAFEPTWSTRINDVGGWSITVPMESPADRDTVRGWCIPWLVSVAVIRKNVVCQAGPLISYQPSDTAQTVQVSGKGIWECFNNRLLFNAAWDPSSKPITDSSADLTINGPLYKIARELVNNGMNWQHRAGGALPIDLPAQIPDDFSNTRTWHGWEMSTPGQRLQELTQVDQGPDVLFQPYLTVVNGYRTIRHSLMIGSPYLPDRGVPLNFSFRRSLMSMSIQGDGSKQANSAYAKGTGMESGQLFGYATNAKQINAGWPALDMVDSNHTSSADQKALNGWATADLSLYGNVPEQWEATVLADADPQWGQYLPGHFANYTVKDHSWIPNGTYRARILGVSGAGSGSGASGGNINSPRAAVKHQLQTFRTS